MPSIKVITPILGGGYYHIFNRGVNKQNVFFNSENFNYFLGLMEKYLSGYVHFLAYCLLPNHFHLIIKVQDELLIENQVIKSEFEIGKLVVKQFRSLFIAYTMAINVQEKRTGSLFESKYKRLEIEDDDYLRYAIFYTHYNPEKHGFSDNFRNYGFSSYSAFFSAKQTKIDREFVLAFWGGIDDFIGYHEYLHEDREAIVIE
jgi:putative transposase